MVTITWSTSSTFASTTSLINHGNVANGANTSAVEVFIRHDGSNPITDCVFYIQPFTGTYSGDESAATDYAEIATAWGADSTSDGFGGFQVNMDKDNSYAAAWGTYSAKDTLDVGDILTFTARTTDGSGNVAVSAASGVPLHVNMGLSTEGEIPTGLTPGVGFQCRVKVPTAEDTAGIRQFDQVLKYTYTS